MYFEDYKIGMVFDEEIEPIEFSEEELVYFGEKYDPRSIHIDKEKAAKSSFGKIISPGSYSNMAFWGQWVKTGIDKEGIIAGTRVEYAEWIRPVFANIEYNISVEIVDKKIRNEGKNGLVTFLMRAFDPNKNLVSKYCCTALVAYKK